VNTAAARVSDIARQIDEHFTAGNTAEALKLQPELDGAKIDYDKANQLYLSMLNATSGGDDPAQRFVPTGGVQVTVDEGDRPFANLAEQCQAVKNFALSGGQRVDARLRKFQDVATGANESVPSEGGFLIQPTLTTEILMPIHNEGPFSSAAQRLPVASNSNFGWINGIDETSRATGSRWGGIRGYRLAEAEELTKSKPKFRRINWELRKYGVLVYSTDELLRDASQFSTIVQTGAREEINFMVNDDILNGLGGAGCTGILTSGAVVSVTKESSQTAATIVLENLVKMWARLDSRSKARAAWYINTDCNPELDLLTFQSGTSGLEPRFVNYGPDGVMRIKGRPVIETEFNATLGTQGDILLADMSQYLLWEKEAVQFASSIHVQFLTDQECFRFIYRADGQAALAAPLTPYKGTATLSPFVVLDTRA